MGTSYRNDQFFNIGTAGETMTGRDTGNGNWNFRDASNPSFIYPDRTIRGELDGKFHTTMLKRGYVRSLRTKVEDISIPIIKCQFQFNPAVITQSVSLSNSLYDVFHQTPEQFAQPVMGGGQNFNFELLFDRSMELNQTDFGGYNPLTSNYEQQFNQINPWELSDPSQVGVLRDLGVFFSTIGQGVSEAQIAYQTALLRRSITLEAVQNGTLADQDVEESISNSASFLNNNVNLGNTAFLIPTPVRVVFSSLYIVEGIVQSTAVELLKFNSAMVPMVAKVTVDMDAKYIGFAKEKTYFQTILDKEVDDYKQEQAAAREQASALASTFNAGAGRIEMMLGAGNTMDTGQGYPLETATPLYDILEFATSEYWLHWRIPNVDGNDNNAITKAFVDGQSVSLNVFPKLRVYGPFSSTSLGSSPSQDVLRQFTSGTPIFTANGTWDKASSTKDLWEDNADGERGPSSRVTTEYEEDDLDSFYFVAHYEVTGTAIIDGTVVNGTGQAYRVFGPGLDYATVHNFNQAITLAWNAPSTIGDVTIQDTTVTLIDGDNASTAPPAAGSTSSVGSRISTGTSRFS